MRRDMPVSSIFQEASFALFEGLRGAQALALDLAGDIRVSCLGAIDPATRTLGYAAAGDATLELALEQHGERGLAWLHAALDERGPTLSVYLAPERPALSLRFAPPSVLGLEDGRYLLRERPTFPSHDGMQDERKALVAALCRPFMLATIGGWLHLGAWDSLDRSWQPDTGRRLLAAALVLDRARRPL